MTWPVTLSLSDTAYPLGVVQRTAYSLADTVTIQVDVEANDIRLTIFPDENKAPLSEDGVRALVLQQLNDFALRDHINRETSGLREILARAALAGCGMSR